VFHLNSMGNPITYIVSSSRQKSRVALIVYERLLDEELASLKHADHDRGGFDFTGADCIGWMKEAGFRNIRVATLTGEYSMINGYR
jgi:hypothetical protein